MTIGVSTTRKRIGPVVLLMSVFGTTMTAFALVGSTGEAYRAGIGTYGWDGTATPKEDSGTAKVLNGQLAMNDVPEFKGTVKAFETAPLYDKEAAAIYPKWKQNFEEWKKVGSDRPYHYLGSGIWYSRIGTTAGEAMVELLGN